MRYELFVIKHVIQFFLHHVTPEGTLDHQLMDTSSGVIGRIRSLVLFTSRGAIAVAESIYKVLVLRIRELSPGGRVRLRFLVYLTMIMSLNYLSTVGINSSPPLLKILRYNTAITKLSLSYVTGYLFVAYINQRLNLCLRHLAIVTVPAMLICLLEEDVIWEAYSLTFCTFLFLVYVSSIVPRQDSMSSIGPVTVIVSMTSFYLSLLLFILPEMAPWQRRISRMSWYFGILLAASGLIIDDLQVVMGSSDFPVGLVKRRARKYAYVVFLYYLVLYYAMAKLITLQKE